MVKTIVALATPPIKSALAVIRVSGNDSLNIVSSIFNKDISKIEKRTAVVGKIIDKTQVIDDVVLIAYKGPNSFTGEDLVEIICHGSMVIANEIISLLLAKGAVMATNGEYSQRAFINKKIDLVQAEAINDMINAISEESKNLSLMALEGQVSDLLMPIKKELGDILALIEVNIDYPEYEDIEVANKNKIIQAVDSINNKVKVLLNDGQRGLLVKEGIKVAIVGKPNVGKSSLLNALLKEDKAIVTDVPGTTRDIVEGVVNVKGIILRLLDTAGIRESQDKIENIGIQKSRDSIGEADLVIVVLDGSKELSIEDEEILRLTKDTKRIVVNNKSDIKVTREGINISCVENNVEPLIDEIYKLFGIEESTFIKPSLANTRQLGLLKRAIEALEKAKSDTENDLPVDLISVSLFDAFNAMKEILGEDNSLDFSKEIFSRFCVGK